MAARKYLNPPIIEAVCEFRVPPETKWDPTIPGLFYERVREQFPHVEVKQIPEGFHHEFRVTERLWLLAEDRKAFIQIGPRVVAVNRLKPYPTWEGFRPMITQAFEALAGTVQVRGLERIGLRYINRVEIPAPSVDLDDYFEFRPFLGAALPQNMAGFIVGCTLPFAGGRDSCNLQLTAAAPETSGSMAFILDLDYFVAKAQAVAVERALGWVDAAHEEVVELFEGCISDRLRELLGEVK